MIMRQQIERNIQYVATGRVKKTGIFKLKAMKQLKFGVNYLTAIDGFDGSHMPTNPVANSIILTSEEVAGLQMSSSVEFAEWVGYHGWSFCFGTWVRKAPNQNMPEEKSSFELYEVFKASK